MERPAPAARPLELAPNDPLIAYFHGVSEAVDLDKTNPHWPALQTLKAGRTPLPEGSSIAEFARQDQEQKEHFRLGYIDGKGESFPGRLNGYTISYEFTLAGKPMAGRTYYLRADDHTIYALRFTGARDKLGRIRNQTDQIARTFKLKQG